MDKLHNQEDELVKKQRHIDENKKDLFLRLSKLRTRMLSSSNASFLASDVFKTDIKFSIELAKMGMPTMGTDGIDVMIDPDFFTNNTVDENIFCLSHECLHILFGHIDMAKLINKDPKIWNIATDAVINASLVVSNIGKIPKECIMSNSDGRVELKINGKKLVINKCHTKNAIDVYAEIIKHCKQNPPPPGQGTSIQDGNGKDTGTMDAHMHKKLSKDEKDEQKRRLNDKMVEGKLKGNMPGWFGDKIGKMLEGVVDWRQELREIMVPMIKTRPTFSKPKRRSVNPDIILPGMLKVGLKISVGIDTSGSIGKREREYFIGELQNIYDQFPRNSVKMSIYFHDTEMYNKIEIQDIDEVMEAKQRSGATCHKDIMNKMEEDGTTMAVFLTDGYSSFPNETAIQHMVWIVTDKQGVKQIPEDFGKKIHVNPNELREEE